MCMSGLQAVLLLQLALFFLMILSSCLKVMEYLSLSLPAPPLFGVRGDPLLPLASTQLHSFIWLLSFQADIFLCPSRTPRHTQKAEEL